MTTEAQPSRTDQAAAEFNAAFNAGDFTRAREIADNEGHMQQLDYADQSASNAGQPGVTLPNVTGGPAMSTATAAPSNEVTGVPSLVAYLSGVADTHAQIAGGEAFLGSLNRMEVGADDRQLVADAQEATQLAAGLWKTAADTVAQHNLPLHEQYSLNPSAGNKAANTNE